MQVPFFSPDWYVSSVAFDRSDALHPISWLDLVFTSVLSRVSGTVAQLRWPTPHTIPRPTYLYTFLRRKTVQAPIYCWHTASKHAHCTTLSPLAPCLHHFRNRLCWWADGDTWQELPWWKQTWNCSRQRLLPGAGMLLWDPWQKVLLKMQDQSKDICKTYRQA
jgi:hypothetical protein